MTYEPLNPTATKADVKRILRAIEYLPEQINYSGEDTLP